jgi:acyl-CoA thioesterase YciA
VHVETWARRRLRAHFGESVKVTEGIFTFVALNEDGSKRVVPPGEHEE